MLSRVKDQVHNLIQFLDGLDQTEDSTLIRHIEPKSKNSPKFKNSILVFEILPEMF